MERYEKLKSLMQRECLRNPQLRMKCSAAIDGVAHRKSMGNRGTVTKRIDLKPSDDKKVISLAE